jgi:hypothetical protein
VGVALDGVPIYSGLNTNGKDFFSRDQSPPSLASALLRIDKCGGSYGMTPSGWRYHYRVMPSCIYDIDESEVIEKRRTYIQDIHELLDSFPQSTGPLILGYSTTGFPIYSPLNSRGLLHENLDNCNGKFEGGGSYAYYSTIQFPYISGCDGPGVYSSSELNISPEEIPLHANVRYKACPGGTYSSRTFENNGCIDCPAGKYSSIAPRLLFPAP